jgi:hypothetical protein
VTAPIPLFVEGCAGLGSMSLALQHGRHCKPPVSRMGNKHGYALAILRVMGLRPGQGAEQYLWCEPDAGCRALLTAYTDPALMREAAEIIRGWRDEDPRELWERLRAEGPIRGFDAREVGRWVQVGAFDPANERVGKSKWGAGDPRDVAPPAFDSIAAASELARYLQVTASNRLITLDPSTMQNSGQGGTTFGGDEFATSAEKVSEAAREVARVTLCTAWDGPDGVIGGASDGFMGPRPETNNGDNKGSTADAIGRRMRPLGLPATIVPDARDIHPPPLPPGCVVYFDFPYLGDGSQAITGYGHDLTLEDQCELVHRWDAAGAAVYVSECVSRVKDFGGAFKWDVDITSTRQGQRRTFSTEKGRTEWLTCNREPAWRPAVQQGLFG